MSDELAKQYVEAQAEIARLSNALAAAQAERARLRAAGTRLLDGGFLPCDYADDEPTVCPGVERDGIPCPWCDLRTALAPAPDGAGSALLAVARAAQTLLNQVPSAIDDPELDEAREALEAALAALEGAEGREGWG